MKHTILFFVCCVTLFCSAIYVNAQSGTGRRGPGGPESVGLKIGTHFPDLTVYDASGNPFHLAQFKGNYTVLVFGCLT